MDAGAMTPVDRRFKKLARHYGVASVSLLHAVRKRWRARAAGFKSVDLMEDGCCVLLGLPLRDAPNVATIFACNLLPS